VAEDRRHGGSLVTGAMRPRLVLHAGTPKTGTKTMQRALFASRQALLERGILYPDVALSHEHKHQWLVNLLNAGDLASFRRHVAEVLEAARTTAATSVVLSTEGLFLHWTDFSSDARRELAALAQSFDVVVWVLFRDPLSFAVSLYAQVLKNPPSHLTECYATSMTLEDAVGHPWFSTRLDYGRFVTEVERLFAGPVVVASKYESSDSVSLVRAFLGVDATLLPSVPPRNVGLRQLGIDLVRRVNALGRAPADRQRLIDNIVEIDRLLAPTSPPITLSAVTRERVARHAAASLPLLDARFGIRWDPDTTAGGDE
jgi:hypothetical protein